MALESLDVVYHVGDELDTIFVARAPPAPASAAPLAAKFETGVGHHIEVHFSHHGCRSRLCLTQALPKPIGGKKVILQLLSLGTNMRPPRRDGHFLKFQITLETEIWESGIPEEVTSKTWWSLLLGFHSLKSLKKVSITTWHLLVTSESTVEVGNPRTSDARNFPYDRLGSAGGKTTVSLAQVSLVRRPRGFDSPSGRKGLSPLASKGRALLSQGRDAAKAALGVDCWKGVPFRCAPSPPQLSPFCRPPPPHVSYLPVGFLTRLRKAWG